MYRFLGQIVSRFPITWIAFWLIFTVIAHTTAPTPEMVWQDGELAFLPESSPSVEAVRIYREAFQSTLKEANESDNVGTSVQQDPMSSSVVVVLQRLDRPNGLTEEDNAFISDVLVKKLEELKRTTPKGYNWTPELEQELNEEIPEAEQVIKSISTPNDDRIGALLTSKNQKATLVIVDLKTEFLERQNRLVVGRIEHFIKDHDLQQKRPAGLSLELSGSATVGRDMLRAEQESAKRTEVFTKGLVIILLLVIYRAPLLALVPLVTVGIAVELAKGLLRLMAGWGWIGLFSGLDVYVTVVAYGAGVDYCLFLIARYKEELDNGLPHKRAISYSIERVGEALATSAGTCIIGIGMMMFSQFGKFRQAGFAISFSLAVAVCVALTFTPAFLLIFGKWAFWPDVRKGEVGEKSGWLPRSSMWSLLQDQHVLERVWQYMADLLRRQPGRVFMATVIIMMPLAIIGVLYQDDVSYGLLSDLPQDEPSVVGAKAVQSHFPAGITGPDTMFIRFPEEVLQEVFDGNDLKSIPVAEKLSATITKNLLEREDPAAPTGHSDELIGIADIRSQHYPLGTNPKALEYLSNLPLRSRGAKRTFAHRTYTSLDGPLAGQVMRLDVILNDDPFSRNSVRNLARLENAVKESIHFPPDSEITPEQSKKLRDSAKIYTLGTTAAIRDIKSVTDHDRILIDVLVTVSVYLIIVLMLRQPEICAYLIITVIFSYVVTIGATYMAFYLWDPVGFHGIDWKVPIYLFTILVAMGEDYNILLMSRVTEEQETHGRTEGVLQALMKTGSIISTCGIIMAGSFVTLMAGSLMGMVQMGFALAFGVLLDTFVVRPILVPAYLILLYDGRFGKFGRFMGAPPDVVEASPTESELVRDSV
ncbi:MMPL family transporter [Planctomicrobium sp. SH661]|uniref:MMPL family transporter n=1 Tax=Planctomicrobium sp. SH661 TaxID=3448124 RepID=UPI003F5C1444